LPLAAVFFADVTALFCRDRPHSDTNTRNRHSTDNREMPPGENQL
jgi:hypothetical protein